MEYPEKSQEMADQPIKPEYQSEQSMTESSSTRSTNDNKKPKKKKKKVEMACVYCRRSHMICDDARPCQRCIKRGIGHLCHDEPTPGRQRKKGESTSPGTSKHPTPALSANPTAENTSSSNQSIPSDTHPESTGYPSSSSRTDPGSLFVQPQQPHVQSQQQSRGNNVGSASFGVGQPGFAGAGSISKGLPFNEEPFFYSEHAGSEFSSLNDFLSMIDDPELASGSLGGTSAGNADSLMSFQMPQNPSSSNLLAFSPNNMPQPTFDSNNNGDSSVGQSQPQQAKSYTNGNKTLYDQSQTSTGPNTASAENQQPVISDSARDKFFLTAADPTTEISPEERLKQVIKAKLEAGLLQPYNYAKGYARLQSYMDNYMNQSSRQRILKPLSIFRPAFRAIARTLKDVDLVLVEESFERMLLDYDRVFTSMAIPACLWRRTGEIYRGNKEFASLVGVTTDDLKDGKLAIYELMSEESAVNFWEKYGAIAFDKGQKAVLTSCNLRTKDGFKRKSCCFSFTIRRDRYNIPSCIVGNFIPIDP